MKKSNQIDVKNKLDVNLFQKYLGIYLILLSIALIASYISGFYLKLPIDNYLLFSSDDPGWVVPGFDARTIIGIHRFGDYQTTLSWAALENPFDPSLEFPSTYAPLQVLLLKPLTLISIQKGLFLWQLLSVLFLVSVIWFLLKSYDNWTKISIIVVTLILTRPFLLMLDRGNVQALVMALVALSIFGLLRNKNTTYLAEIAIILAASLKYYPILLVLVFLFDKRYASIIRVLVGTFIGIFLPLLIVSKGFVFEAIQGMLKGMSVQATYPTSGSSLGAWFLRFSQELGLTVSINDQLTYSKFLSLGAAVIFGSLILWAILSQRIGKVQTIVLTLSLLTLTVPVSWGYNLMWASLAVVLLLEFEDWRKFNFSDQILLFGFIPLLIIFPWISDTEGVVNSGIAEYYATPFIITLFFYWLFISPANQKLAVRGAKAS